MSESLPPLKPCPICDGPGRMVYGELPLATCEDEQCGFISSHYYWQGVKVLLTQPTRARIAALEAEVGRARMQADRDAHALAEEVERACRAEAEVARLRDAVLWACGVNGRFPARGDGQGVYYWRPALRRRAGISDEELNAAALRGEGE